MTEPNQMAATFQAAFDRLNKHVSQGEYAGTMHGDFHNEAGELEFDVEFPGGVRDAVAWAEQIRDSWGLRADIRDKDSVTSLWESVVLTVRVSYTQAARVIGARQMEQVLATLKGGTH